MKTTFILCSLIFLPVMCYSASGINDTHCGNVKNFNPPFTNPLVNITVLNTFTCPYAAQILGLDYSNSFDELVFSSNSDGKWYACNPNDGTYLSSLEIPYSGSFGIAVNDDWSVTFGNSGEDNRFFYFDGTWHSYANPASYDGRGMDFDGTYIWESDGPYGGPDQVVRFLPDGSDINYYSVSVISLQMSGLTYFIHDSTPIIIITCYTDCKFYFFSFDGSSLTFLGSTPCPASCFDSFDITYSADRGTFFWSYEAMSEDYTISELDIDLFPDSIQPASLGYVKAMYK